MAPELQLLQQYYGTGKSGVSQQNANITGRLFVFAASPLGHQQGQTAQ